jgi:MFS family permease
MNMGRTLAAIAAACVLSSFCSGLIGPVYPIFILHKVEGSLKDIGLLYGFFYVVSATLKILAGKLVDKYGRTKIFVFGGILGALCTWGYIVSFNPLHLYILEFFNGLAYALQSPAFLVLLSEATSPQNRGFEIGVLDSTYDLAGAVASFISGSIVVIFGFDFLFYLCSGFQAVSSVIVFAFGRT